MDEVSTLLRFLQDELDELYDDGKVSLVLNIKQMMFDRIKFSLSAYLRTRLNKIEKNINNICTPPGLNPRIPSTAQAKQEADKLFSFLSDAEKVFANQFSELLSNHFSNSFLMYLPKKEFATQTDIDMVSKSYPLGKPLDTVFFSIYSPPPQVFMSYAFFFLFPTECVLARANRDINLGQGDILGEGQIIMIPFRLIENYVLDNSVDLL